MRKYLKKILYSILARSLQASAKEQGLNKLIYKLKEIVPDITDQYSTFKLNKPYLKNSTRNLHAFQILLVNEVIEKLKKPVIVDIGDSAGTHLQYIAGLHSKNKDIKTMSINLDPVAIQKIREKGFEAMHIKAENLQSYNINASIFLCLEILEHLMSPCHFLHDLSLTTKAEYLVATVPYLRISRVGLGHIRRGFRNDVYAENTHIFELNPEDWKLIVRHSGWDIVKEKIYLQYPTKGFFRITKPFWKKFDFEGFYGLILKKSDTWSTKYQNW